MLMCKICIARRLVVDSFPWCNANFVPFPLRAECKTGKLQDPGYRTHNLTLFSQKLKHVSICGPGMRSQGWWRLFWKCHIRPTWHCYHALQARPNNSRSFATLLLLYRVSKKKSAIVTRAPFCEIFNSFWKLTGWYKYYINRLHM